MLNTIGSKTLYSNKYMDLKEHHIEYDENKKKNYYVINSPEFVACVVCKGNKVLFVSQYRVAVNETCRELVCGIIDPGETPKEAALRELKEEAGIIAKDATFVGVIFPMSGLMSVRGHVFVVKEEDIEKEVEPELESFEKACGLTQEWLDLEEFSNELLTNKIKSGISIAAITVAATFLDHHNV